MLGSLRQRCPARATATRRQVVPRAAASHAYPPAEDISRLPTQAPTDILYDAVIIGSGMGGLATAGQLIAKGAKVVVLEKCVSSLACILPRSSAQPHPSQHTVP